MATGGTPAVVVVTEEFDDLARRVASLCGCRELPRLVLPYPLEGRPDREVRAIADRAFDELVALLTGE